MMKQKNVEAKEYRGKRMSRRKNVEAKECRGERMSRQKNVEAKECRGQRMSRQKNVEAKECRGKRMSRRKSLRSNPLGMESESRMLLAICILRNQNNKSYLEQILKKCKFLFGQGIHIRIL